MYRPPLAAVNRWMRIRNEDGAERRSRPAPSSSLPPPSDWTPPGDDPPGDDDHGDQEEDPCDVRKGAHNPTKAEQGQDQDDNAE